MKEYLTLEEVASRLGIDLPAVAALIRSGELLAVYVTVLPHWQVEVGALTAYIEAHR